MSKKDIKEPELIIEPLVTTKKMLCDAIRKRLKGIDFPAQITISKGETITNVPVFFSSHILYVENYNNDVGKPYADRLQKALLSIGIDVNEIKKSIKC